MMLNLARIIGGLFERVMSTPFTQVDTYMIRGYR